MKHNFMLSIASLLSILFSTFQLTDDIVRGMEPGTLSNLTAVPILVLWPYGTLVLGRKAIRVRDRPPRVAPWVVGPCHPHEGSGVGSAIANSSGAFFFIWTLLALGVTALFSVILSARGLWEHLPRRTAGQHKQGAPA